MSLRGLAAGMLMSATRQLPGEKITYRLFVLSEQNPQQGRTISRFYDVDIQTVVMAPVENQELGTPGSGPVQIGDVKFTFPSFELDPYVQFAKSKATSTSDRIVHDNATYRVIMIQEVGRAILVVTARKAE